MPNSGQPTLAIGATGDAVRRLQRALRRTPNLGLVVDGDFGPATPTRRSGSSNRVRTSRSTASSAP